MQAQNANDGVQLSTISSSAFAARFSSKSEVVNFLLFDLEAYLPPKHCISIWFCRDIVTGRSKSIILTDTLFSERFFKQKDV